MPLTAQVPSEASSIPTTVDSLIAFAPFVIGATLIFICFLLFLNWLLRRLYQHNTAYKKVIMQVIVPRDVGKKDDQQVSRDAEKEQIAVAETLYSAIGGLRAERSLRSYLWGRQDHLSLEIVAHKGMISFYVVVPRYLHKYIEEHIHAQYPAAVIDEVSDYNVFLPHGVTVGSVLTFQREFMFPIRTYKEMESDPMSAITNAMSRLGTNGAAVQIVIRSAKRKWHRPGRKTASELHQGKSLDQALYGQWLKKILGVFGHVAYSVIDSPNTNKQSSDSTKPHQLSALEQEMAKRIEEKTSKAGVDANIRVLVSAPTKDVAEQGLANLLNSFTQFNMYQFGNSFRSIRFRDQERFFSNFIYRHYSRRRRIVLNTEELASLYHLPLPTTETPNIKWLRAKKAPAPQNIPNEGIILGHNTYRGETKTIRFAEVDRRRHLYVIGTTGSGKSTIMGEMAIQDIENGKGVCIVDPHGSLADDVLSRIPKERADDVIYFDPSDVARPVGLNMLEANTEAEMDFVTQEMIAIFYKLVSDPSMIGPMFEHNMRNAMLTLMADKEFPGTIAEIPRIFSDQEFQKYKVTKVKDPMVRAFWEKEMAKTSDFHKSEMLGYLISKVGAFVENTMMRNIIGQPKSGFNVREVMDNQKILLVNLSKGKIGEINSNLLGLIIVSKLQMAALARADDPSASFPDFYLYIDEFQNFITDSIATILSEARKYKLNLTMAHQYMGQLVKNNDTAIRDAVLGNVGSMAVFRIGVEDAEVFAKQFHPVFNEYDVVNIEKFNCYMRLLIDNTAARPFDMAALAPKAGQPERAAIIKEASRLRYGRERALIEAEILERSKLGEESKPLPQTEKKAL